MRHFYLPFAFSSLKSKQIEAALAIYTYTGLFISISETPAAGKIENFARLNTYIW